MSTEEKIGIDEYYEICKQSIGKDVTNEEGIRPDSCFNQEATLDTIRHFSLAIGDDNSLYTDPKYANKTRWDGMIAPPTWLITVDSTGRATPEADHDLQTFRAGVTFEYNRPVELGDSFNYSLKVKDVEKKTGRENRDMILVKGEGKYYNEDMEHIATINSAEFKMPRSGERNIDRDLKQWNDKEIKKLEDEIMAQTKRGSKTRYWEDVEPDETIGEIIKGPLSLNDIASFYQGATMSVPTPCELFVKKRRNNPEVGIRRQNGVYESSGMGHLDSEIAQSIGLPGFYDLGSQRAAWMIQAVTDWMSDDGWVKKYKYSTHDWNFVGDVTRFNGEVTDKYEYPEGEESCVDIELSGVNQEGIETISGDCTVILPTENKT